MQPWRRLISIGLIASALVVVAACGKDASKQELLASGNKYFEQKKYAEAIIEYKKALQQDPKFAEAQYKLAQSYDQLGDGNSASREYTRAADLMPNDPEAQVRDGWLLLAGGDFRTAKARAMKALALNPRHLEAQVLLAQSLAEMKDMDGAVRLVEEAIQMEPGEGRTYAQLGRFQMAQGKVDQAEAAFKRAVSLDPKSLFASIGLAQFYLATGRLKDAEEWLNKSVAIEPENYAANRSLAAFYLGTGHLAEAEAPLKIAARVSPIPAQRLVLADYYFTFKKRDQARQVLEALKGEPTMFSGVRLRLSLIEMDAGHSQEAYKLVDEVLTKDPHDSQANLLKGRYLLAEDRVQPAMDLFKISVKYDPKLHAAHYWLGMTYRQVGDPDNARVEFGEVQRLAPWEVGSKVQLAQMDLLSGDLNAASALANDAVSIQPNFLPAHIIHVDVLIAQGKLPAASAEATRVAALLPKLPAPLMQLGRIAMAQGDFAGAERAFQKAFDLSNGGRDAFGEILNAKVAAGKIKDAQALGEQRVAQFPKDPWLRIYAARAYMAGHQTAKAEAELRTALSMDATNLAAYLDLTRIYLEGNNLDQARAQLEAIVAKDPKAVWAHTAIAISLHIQGRKPEAMQRYEKIIQIDPKAAVASNNLAMMYLDEGRNIDKALELAQAAKREMPDSPEVNDTLGLIFCKKGLAPSAIPPLELSSSKDPGNPVYRYHLGLAYAQAGQKAKAKAALQQALAQKSDFEGAADARRVLADLSK